MGLDYILTVTILLIGFQLPLQTDAFDDTSSHHCTLDGESYPSGTLTKERCIQYKCIDGNWKYDDLDLQCSNCQYQGQTTFKTYADHLIDKTKLRSSYQFDGSEGSYYLTQYELAVPSNLSVEIKYGYISANETSITSVLYAETGIKVEFVSSGPNNDAKVLVNGTEIELKPNGPMVQRKSTVGTVFISNDSPSWPRPNGGHIQIVGSQGLTVSIWAWRGYAQFVNSYAMPFMTNLYGLCDVLPDPIEYPKGYTMQNGSLTTNINEFTASWKVGAVDIRAGVAEGTCAEGGDGGINGAGEDEKPWWTCGRPIDGCGEGFCVAPDDECINGVLPGCSCRYQGFRCCK